MMSSKNPSFPSKAKRLLAAVALAGVSLLGLGEQTASAQEIQLTGPLAGAPAVKGLRLYRKGRLELSPNLSATLLDEYRRQFILGLRANYGITDWLAVGVWGGITTSMLGLDVNTSLTENVQDVNYGRNCSGDAGNPNPVDPDCQFTEVNLGNDFREQIASINWMVAPQLTAVPFRGKLGLFGDLYVDSELYVFAGPAFVGLTERADCAVGQCPNAKTNGNFNMADRVAIAPTFGLGFTFFLSKWTAVGAEYRAIPFNMNTGGFDVAGGGKDNAFPDGAVNDSDRQFKFNQMLTLSFNMYLPTAYKVSE
ncbi:MAG TPA: hypothetical protein VLC09_10405 [Polyangiaceae bacterium]|nr:hypothetical protein [Polyangiaceae bacterium]